jgi:ribosomal protein L37E
VHANGCYDPPAEVERVIICKKCGNHNQDQDQFCSSCGTFLEWSGERVVEEAPPPPEPEPAPPPPPPAGIVEKVKQAVGMEGKEAAPSAGDGKTAAPPASGGWVPPASVTGAAATTTGAGTGTDQPATPATGQAATPPVAPTGGVPEARRPEAIPPTPPRPRPVPKTAPVEVAQEVGVFCTRCGMSNDTHRHFCRRCGAPLVQTVAPRVPWYRRIMPRRQAPVAGERHAPVRTVTFGSLLRTFLVTMLVVLLAGGLLAYAAVPTFRQAVNARVDTLATQARRQLGAGIVEVHPVGARASSELSGHPARFAADLINNDYWAADVARDHQPTLVVSFDGPTDLDYLLVMSGAPGQDYARLARPRSVQLVYSDGTGEQITLRDDPKPTQYTIHARGVTTVSVRVDSVYPVAGTSSVALTEMEFYHLR